MNRHSSAKAQIPEEIEDEEIENIEVTEADPDDQGAVEEWVRVVTSGFAGRPSFSEPESRVFAAASKAAGSRLYLAYYRSCLAGGGLLKIIGQTALLSTASTLTGLRGCGIQAVLLAARIRDAFQSGCDLVGVMASPGSASQRNILRAGFHEVYTKPVFTSIAGLAEDGRNYSS